MRLRDFEDAVFLSIQMLAMITLLGGVAVVVWIFMAAFDGETYQTKCEDGHVWKKSKSDSYWVKRDQECLEAK